MRIQGRRASLVVIVTLGLAVAGAPGARADEEPSLAVEPGGTAHVAWLHPDGSTKGLQERSRLSNGVLSPIQWMSPAGVSAFRPSMAVDASGTVAYVWQQAISFGLIQARRRMPDGSLSAVRNVTSASPPVLDPHIAVEPDGDAVLTWARVLDFETVVIEARRWTAAGVLGPVKTLSSPDDVAQGARAAVDAAGNAMVAWRSRDPATEEVVMQTRRIAADGSLGAVTPLSAPAQDALSLRVAMDGAGNTFFAWRRYDGTRYVPQLRRRSAGGAYAATQTLSTGATVLELDLAVSAGGTALVTWGRNVPERTVVQARHRAVGGALGSLLTLSSTSVGSAVDPRAAMDPGGNAVVTWSRFESGAQTIHARRRSAGGAVGPIKDISDSSRHDDPRVGMDRDGNAVLVWTSMFDRNVVQTRRLLPTGALTPIQTLSY